MFNELWNSPWRAVCTEIIHIFTASFWSAITYYSSYSLVHSSFRVQSQQPENFCNLLKLTLLLYIVISIVARVKPQPRGRDDLT